MRPTKFGNMKELSYPGILSGQYEVMCFEDAGTFHIHDQTEIAVCVKGRGIVRIGSSEVHAVTSGDQVIIPAGAAHRMEPNSDDPVWFVILYEERA